MSAPIYLDHHATTPVDPRVLERMLPYFSEHFGNAASPHAFGWRAAEAAEAGREAVGKLIGAEAREIIFTSGATEANNLALRGVLSAYAGARRHLITQATEHPAVLAVCRALEREGLAELTILPVDRLGLVDPEAVRTSLRPDTAAVSIMMVNNEVGTVQPIASIGGLCREAGVLFHCDATQGVGVLPLDLGSLPVDLLSMSAHKMYGPKGVGALFARRRRPRALLEPILFGGEHESGMRPGTLNIPGIVGFSAAAELLRAELPGEALRLGQLRDRLWGALRDLPGIERHGHPTLRHPGNLHVTIDNLDAEAVLLGMRPIAVASGAACATGTKKPSHVLQAMGIANERAAGSLRFGIGRFNTEAEIDTAAARLRAIVQSGQAQQLAPGQTRRNG